MLVAVTTFLLFEFASRMCDSGNRKSPHKFALRGGCQDPTLAHVQPDTDQHGQA